MVKYALTWTSLLLVANLASPTVQQPIEEPVSTLGLQVVYEQNDSTANWAASFNDFLPKIHADGFARAKASAGDNPFVNSYQCGPLPYKTVLRPNGMIHVRYFITNLIPTHHRTETKTRHWKNVLSLKPNGTMLTWMEGDPAADAVIAKLERKQVNVEMIALAQALCDQHHVGNGRDSHCLNAPSTPI